VRHPIFIEPTTSKARTIDSSMKPLHTRPLRQALAAQKKLCARAMFIPPLVDLVKMYIRPHLPRGTGGEFVVTRSRPRRPRSTRDITARQREVLGLIALGLTNKEMAHSLGITERGAAAHVSRLLARFEVPNRAGLISRTLSDALSLPVLLERELEAYSNSAFMIGLTIGPDDVLVYVNKAGQRMAGIGPESETSARFISRRASGGTNAFREGARRAFRTGRATTVEQQQARWLRDDGTWSSGGFSCLLQPVREATGNVFGLLWICMPSVGTEPAR